jgi:hypothetical protein
MAAQRMPASVSAAGSEMDIDSIAHIRKDTLSPLLAPYLRLRLQRQPDHSFRLDTVSHLYLKYIGELKYLNDPFTPERYLPPVGIYSYRLFVPLTYYYSPIRSASRIDWHFDPFAGYAGVDDAEQRRALLPYNEATFTEAKRVDALVDGALLYVYTHSAPGAIRLWESDIRRARAYRDNLTKEASARRPVARFFVPDAKTDVAEGVDVKLKRPNWWVTTGAGSLQFSQNYVSKNWYKGGESSVNLLGNLLLTANYNDRQKVQWENLLELKLGLASTPSDTIHGFLFNTDQLRLYSKLGLQAATNWFYTMSAEIKTQFFNGYKANNATMVSAFLAPADLAVSMGMDYKLNKPKYNLSVFLAPLTYALRYVGNDKVDETSFGLKAGRHTKHDFGSQVSPTLSWKIISSITFDSRLNYLTSYKWTRIEWENTINFVLNRYLSTKFYWFARFDDSSVPKGDSKSYFQLKELLSFGINYTW